MATADEFRTELMSLLQQAEQDGKPWIEIKAGDLHQKVQSLSPTRSSRIPNCCSVMRQEQKRDDAVVSERASDGSTFTIRFKLPR